MFTKKNVFRLLALSLLSSAALAASVPNTFTAGDTARASDMNANFAAVVTALNTLEAKVAALEAVVGPQTMASLAGTYDLFDVAVDVDSAGAGQATIAGLAVYGTVVFNANGTGSNSSNTQYRQVALATSTVDANNTNTTVQVSSNPWTNSDPFSWSFANGVVTVTTPAGNASFRVVGQLLIGNILNEGQSGISIAARRLP
jgi:hypothetical protein